MFISNNEEMAKKARLLRSHGMTTMSYQRASGHATAYDIVALGYNFRLDDIRASIAIEQLKKLPGDLEVRAKVRQRYVELLSKVKDMVVPFADCNEFTSNYIFPTVLLNRTREQRDAIRDYLHEQGIQTSIHYPTIHRFSVYKEWAHSFRRPSTSATTRLLFRCMPPSPWSRWSSSARHTRMRWTQ